MKAKQAAVQSPKTDIMEILKVTAKNQNMSVHTLLQSLNAEVTTAQLDPRSDEPQKTASYNWGDTL